MDTKKLIAIWRIIRNKNFTLITVNDDSVKGVTRGAGDLKTAIIISTTLLSIHKELSQQIEDQAAEGGELHALQALRAAIDTIGNK